MPQSPFDGPSPSKETSRTRFAHKNLPYSAQCLSYLAYCSLQSTLVLSFLAHMCGPLGRCFPAFLSIIEEDVSEESPFLLFKTYPSGILSILPLTRTYNPSRLSSLSCRLFRKTGGEQRSFEECAWPGGTVGWARRSSFEGSSQGRAWSTLTPCESVRSL